MLTRRAKIALPAAVMVVALTNPCAEKAAHAQSASQCTALAEEAQRLRADGRLVEARDRLTACSVPQCPQVVRADCAQWATEVLAATPTIVIDAKDETGGDIAEAKVFVDHRPVADRIDGRPIAVNPGTRLVRVDRPNGQSATETIVAKENVKARAVTITFGGASASTQKREADGSGGWGWGQYAGVGLVVIGAALITYSVVSYVSYRSTESNLKDRHADAQAAVDACSKELPDRDCSQENATERSARDDYSQNESDTRAKTPILVVAGIGGTLAVAGGIVLFILGPRGTSSSSKVTGGPVITPHYAGMALGGSF